MAFACSQLDSEENITQPVAYEVVAPWVRISFTGPGGDEITVGNQSAPGATPKHTAVIKSFQYGFSGGSGPGSDGATVEIYDEQGSEFHNFMLKVLGKNRDAGAKAEDFRTALQFGWTVSSCTASRAAAAAQHCKKPGANVLASALIYSYPMHVDMNFEGGKIKFTINLANPIEFVAQTNAVKKPFGKDGNPLSLKNALRELWREQGFDVCFPKKDKTGPNCGKTSCGCELEWMFHPSLTDKPCEGPKLTWKTNNRDPLEVTMDWLKEFRTAPRTSGDAGKGFIVGTKNDSPGRPTIAIWESFDPDCQGNVDATRHIGNYIVNGGSCSPVINFRPTWKWYSASTTGSGGGMGQTSATAVEQKNACDVSGEGLPNRTVPSGNLENSTGKDAAAQTERSTQAQQRANAGGYEPIQAELTVQGNPALFDPMWMKGKYLGIIFINPFHLRESENGCSQFLAEPPINPWLTNSNWFIDGVDHQIKDGSFTTTFKLFLYTPGVNIDRNAPLGGKSPFGAPFNHPTMPNT